MKQRSIAVIDEVQERQETLPKAIGKSKAKPANSSRRMLSLSPEGDTEGYKRACGCNRKHWLIIHMYHRVTIKLEEDDKNDFFSSKNDTRKLSAEPIFE